MEQSNRWKDSIVTQFSFTSFGAKIKGEVLLITQVSCCIRKLIGLCTEPYSSGPSSKAINQIPFLVKLPTMSIASTKEHQVSIIPSFIKNRICKNIFSIETMKLLRKVDTTLRSKKV